MSDKTAIQWTDRTWTPLTGCTRVSLGCDHCYAFQLHDQRHIAWKRGRWPTAPPQYHQPFSTVQLLPDRLIEPLRWRTPSRVFLTSMGDVFHEDLPEKYLAEIFGVMARTPQHTYQVLTKRPERMARLLNDLEWVELVAYYADWGETFFPWPLPNVWLGTTVENEAAARARLGYLRQCPAAVRFLSMEPLLEAVNLDFWFGLRPGYEWRPCVCAEISPVDRPCITCVARQDLAAASGISWVIIGGESGPHARPFDLAWARDLIGQCRAAGVPVFVKQLGAVWAKESGAKHAHGGNPDEWPEDLRVREWPTVKEAAGHGV